MEYTERLPARLRDTVLAICHVSSLVSGLVADRRPRKRRSRPSLGKFLTKIRSLESERAVQVPFMQPPAFVPRYLIEPNKEAIM
jgi:hypothetical protein